MTMRSQAQAHHKARAERLADFNDPLRCFISATWERFPQVEGFSRLQEFKL